MMKPIQQIWGWGWSHQVLLQVRLKTGGPVKDYMRDRCTPVPATAAYNQANYHSPILLEERFTGETGLSLKHGGNRHRRRKGYDERLEIGR